MRGGEVAGDLFPAHAGMNRNRLRAGRADAAVPRTRGDEPYGFEHQFQVADLFPAHAGMNRPLQPSSSCLRPVPRTRGDEPTLTKVLGFK